MSVDLIFEVLEIYLVFKVLIIDLVSGSQSAAGYLGSEVIQMSYMGLRKFNVFFVSCPMSLVQTGKWRKPTGVLVDQVGHLLVVDQVQFFQIDWTS